jgi:hypothetical protein
LKEEVEIITDVEIKSERIDQIPLIYGFLERMRVAGIIDAVLPKPHGNWKGLSYGELVAGFIISILLQCDHRISYIDESAANHIETLRHFFLPRQKTSPMTARRHCFVYSATTKTTALI